LKLHRSLTTGRNVITAYGPGYVQVNQDRYERSLIVTAEEVADWAPASLAELQPEHMQALIERRPEVVLLGTGPALRFPRPDILRPLMQARVGFEVMDLPAACRTYNILVDEERRVAAALLFA